MLCSSRGDPFRRIARGLRLHALPPDNELTFANGCVAQLDPDSCRAHSEPLRELCWISQPIASGMQQGIADVMEILPFL